MMAGVTLLAGITCCGGKGGRARAGLSQRQYGESVALIVTI